MRFRFVEPLTVSFCLRNTDDDSPLSKEGARRDCGGMLSWKQPHCKPFRKLLAHPKLIPYLNTFCGQGKVFFLCSVRVEAFFSSCFGKVAPKKHVVNHFEEKNEHLTKKALSIFVQILSQSPSLSFLSNYFVHGETQFWVTKDLSKLVKKTITGQLFFDKPV